MKLTVKQLKRLIKEEASKILKEGENIDHRTLPYDEQMKIENTISKLVGAIADAINTDVLPGYVEKDLLKISGVLEIYFKTKLPVLNRDIKDIKTPFFE